MDFKQRTWKFKWKNDKDKWLALLVVGLALLIFAFPTGKSTVKKEVAPTQVPDDIVEAAAKITKTYEEQMEERVQEILSHVEGIGKVDVMIVLKSSEEKVIRVDTDTSISSTKETDSSGGVRSIESSDVSENTILTGSGENGAPIIEKEMKPEVSGIVVSAAGGGSAKVKAEISEAMEALFDIPAHKIKVLKRVE